MKLLLALLPILLINSIQALPPAAYEPIADTPFWLEADVIQQFPTEPILRETDYLKSGSTYFVSPSDKTQAEVAWIEATGQWLEPRKAPATATAENIVITSKGADLIITAPDGKKMETVTIGSIIPEGSSLQSKDTWAAITLGNTNTLHLMPNTKVKVSMKSDSGKLNTAINLESGGVFSKVGKRTGLVQDYRVQTPQGIAAARGTDYVTLALPTRMEVWIAEGKVEVMDLKGVKIGEVAASDDKALKVLRTPAILDSKDNAAANAAIMTAAFNFVGQTNIANQAIQTKQLQKQELTLEEQELLKNTIPVKYLVKVRKAN